MTVQLRIFVFLCVTLNVVCLKLASGAKKLRFTELYPTNDISSLAEMLVQADPDAVQEIITLLETIKTDSIETETELINALNQSQEDTVSAYDEYQVAKEDREQAEIVEDEKEDAHSAAELVETQAGENYFHQKPRLDHDQEAIDTIISLLITMNFTTAPTTSPTVSSTPPTSSPTRGEILLMKLKAGSTTFRYDSPYWTNSATLNDELGSADDFTGDAKMDAFNTVSVRKLKLCYGSLSNCYIYDVGQTYDNAALLFNSGYLRSDNMGGGSLSAADAKRAYTDVFLPPQSDPLYQKFWDGGSGNNCGLQLPGINTQADNPSATCKARIGYLVNFLEQECTDGDTDDSDTPIGFGLDCQGCNGGINAPFKDLGYTKDGWDEPIAKQGWIFAV